MRVAYCYLCKEHKDSKEFYADNSRGNGFASSCKSCTKARNRLRRSEQPIKYGKIYSKKQHKEYYLNHSEYLKELGRQQRIKNNLEYLNK